MAGAASGRGFARLPRVLLRRDPMKPHLLPLTAAIVPVVAVHLCLWLAIRAEAIPPCLPYLEGCASISATGRQAPASFVFKPVMTTQWVLLCLYWSLNYLWLRGIVDGFAGSPQIDRPRTDRAWLVLGCTGAFALVLYTTFLGTTEPFYEFMRRFGIYLFFAFTVIAQMMLAARTIELARAMRSAELERIGRWQRAIAWVPLLLGILNAVLKSVLDDANAEENVIEWHAALFMQVFLLFSAFAWRATGFGLHGSVAGRTIGAARIVEPSVTRQTSP